MAIEPVERAAPSAPVATAGNNENVNRHGAFLYRSPRLRVGDLAADPTGSWKSFVNAGKQIQLEAGAAQRVDFGVKDPVTGKYVSNNHVPYKD